MKSKKSSRNLKIPEINISKYTSEGKIPAIRIGYVWRSDKDLIDGWISVDLKARVAVVGPKRENFIEKNRRSHRIDLFGNRKADQT